MTKLIDQILIESGFAESRASKMDVDDFLKYVESSFFSSRVRYFRSLCPPTGCSLFSTSTAYTLPNFCHIYIRLPRRSMYHLPSMLSFRLLSFSVVAPSNCRMFLYAADVPGAALGLVSCRMLTGPPSCGPSGCRREAGS
jgi:hypothetical protein